MSSIVTINESHHSHQNRNNKIQLYPSPIQIKWRKRWPPVRSPFLFMNDHWRASLRMGPLLAFQYKTLLALKTQRLHGKVLATSDWWKPRANLISCPLLRTYYACERNQLSVFFLFFSLFLVFFTELDFSLMRWVISCLSHRWFFLFHDHNSRWWLPGYFRMTYICCTSWTSFGVERMLKLMSILDA